VSGLGHNVSINVSEFPVTQDYTNEQLRACLLNSLNVRRDVKACFELTKTQNKLRGTVLSK
jgi:hypothetical protein